MTKSEILQKFTLLINFTIMLKHQVKLLIKTVIHIKKAYTY